MQYILSIGMNDYRNRAGGTNKVILAHQELFRKHGYGYIYICPVKEKKYKFWEVIINNHFCCVRSTEQLILFLYHLQVKNNYISEVHIHHLLSVSLDTIDSLLSYIEGNIKYYIHDYYSICPSIKLMKNDLKYCGSEMMSKKKCGDCKYYQSGKENNAKLEKKIMKYENSITLVAPSDVAKNIWLNAYDQYQDKVMVIYHQKLQGNYTGNKELVKDEIKIGYLGEASYPKGWAVWNMIVEMMSEKRYRFFYFGKDKLKMKKVSDIHVDFRKNLDAMVHALRKNPMDCVLLWSILEETYSYTYYESLAANTFVITNEQSGNIARQVKVRKNGIVLHSEKELIELMQNFDLLKRYINEFKQSHLTGPDKLVENPELLEHINTDTNKNVSKIKESAPTLEERIFSLYYKCLQGIYCMKRIWV